MVSQINLSILLGLLCCFDVVTSQQIPNGVECGNRRCSNVLPYCCERGSRPRCVVEERNCVPLTSCGDNICSFSTPYCCGGNSPTAYCTENAEVCNSRPCGNTSCSVVEPFCCGEGDGAFCTNNVQSCSIYVVCGNGTCSPTLPFCCGSGENGYCVANENTCVPRKRCGFSSYCTESLFCCGAGNDVTCTDSEADCDRTNTICGDKACPKSEPVCCELGESPKCIAEGDPCVATTTTPEPTTTTTTESTTTPEPTTTSTTSPTTTSTTTRPVIIKAEETTKPSAITTKKLVLSTQKSNDFINPNEVIEGTDFPVPEKRFNLCGTRNCTAEEHCCGAEEDAYCSRVPCEETSNPLSIWVPIVIAVFVLFIILVVIFVWKCTPFCSSKEGYEVTPKIAPVTLTLVTTDETAGEV